MAKKETKDERRRWKKDERKPWTEEQRKEFVEAAERFRPYVEHLTTPAPAAKKKSIFDDLPVVD